MKSAKEIAQGLDCSLLSDLSLFQSLVVWSRTSNWARRIVVESFRHVRRRNRHAAAVNMVYSLIDNLELMEQVRNCVKPMSARNSALNDGWNFIEALQKQK